MKSNPSFRLAVMEKRLKDMIMLIELWSKYVDIIYASESEMNIMSLLRDDGLYENSSFDGMNSGDLSFA